MRPHVLDFRHPWFCRACNCPVWWIPKHSVHLAKRRSSTTLHHCRDNANLRLRDRIAFLRLAVAITPYPLRIALFSRFRRCVLRGSPIAVVVTCSLTFMNAGLGLGQRRRRALKCTCGRESRFLVCFQVFRPSRATSDVVEVEWIHA